KIPEALAKTRQAAAILAGGIGTAAVQERVAVRLAELQFVTELEEIRTQRTLTIKDVEDRSAASDQRYVQTFRAFGIDVDALSFQEAARRIRQSSVAVEVAAALDDWARMVRRIKPLNEPRWKNLLALARAADPDRQRDQLRQALEQGDSK